MIDLLMFGPSFATGFAGFCIYKGLQERQRFAWLWVASGLAILAGICYELFRTSGLAPVAAFIIGFFCACVAFICALWLAWALKRWRKLAALVLGVVFPLSMWVSVQAGETRSPESITRRNGDVIAQTLHRYQAGAGNFPSELAALEPSWLAKLPKALTTQHTGWLYTSSDDSFTLGYWYGPEKFGAWVCLYDSSTPLWECDLNNWGPFDAVPTPMPCRNPQGEWVDTADCQ